MLIYGKYRENLKVVMIKREDSYPVKYNVDYENENDDIQTNRAIHSPRPDSDTEPWVQLRRRNQAQPTYTLTY